MTYKAENPVYVDLGIDPKFYDQLDDAKESITGEILELIEQIELIRHMLSKDRKKAKDLPRDKSNRIIVNLAEPHILEDMDYFRQPALYYKKHGIYTHLYPNRHPSSEYMKFWTEEARRCKEGYIRKEDGEWIPGYYYWYLNYSPIHLTKQILDEDGNPTDRAERVYDFPNPWDSDYLFFHYVERAESLGLFGDVLKTRGRGYSFKCGSMLTRNFYFFPRSKSYALASESEYLTSDGILNKAWDTLDFVDENTPFKKSRDKKNTMEHRKASYVDPETNVERGIKSEIIGVTLKNNPEKARGKRGKLLLFEESGIFPGLLKAWAIARPSLEDGPVTFGFMVAFGTGGTEGAAFEGAEELFYNPKGYRILPMKNVYDKVRGKGECAFFVPEYMSRKNCYDEDGNSDVLKALIQIIEGRENIRLNTTDPNTLTQEKADRPITPQESVMRKEGTLFPVSDLKDYLGEISPNLQAFVAPHYIGRLSVNSESGTVDYKPDADAKVVREFPIKDNVNKDGAIEIFELPKSGGNGIPPRFRYIAGIDPIDDDHSTTNSLGSIFIMDLITDRIVAEYTGRPRTANLFYETCLRMLKFYNAIANYENDKKGLFGYFSNNNQLSYLADNPQILKDMEYTKQPNAYGNKAKGTNSGTKVNAWGRRLQADWMLSKNEASNGKINLHTIRSIGYLKETINWNPDGNFDRISAMGMLMILREEYYKYVLHLKDDGNTTNGSKHAEDPFFTNNWKGGETLEEFASKSYMEIKNNLVTREVYNGVISKN
jgi:hypothetical protein